MSWFTQVRRVGRRGYMADSQSLLETRLPLVAILRGIVPSEAADVAEALVQSGIEIIEVTLNSLEPFASIEAIARRAADAALIGAGTVLLAEQVPEVRSAGGQLIISPNYNPDVVAETVSAGLVSLPGVFSPSEMFSALAAGATGLKVFPADACPPSAVKAVRAVLPTDTSLFVVGGIDGENMRSYLQAGATGFGIGGSLYKAGKSASDVERDAKAIVAKFKEFRQSL